MVASSVDSILFSTDFGRSWQGRNVPRGMSYGKTVVSYNDDIFALRDSFIIVSYDQCNSWETIRLPAWFLRGYISAIHIENGIVFIAGTYGVWKVPLNELSSNVVPKNTRKTLKCIAPTVMLHSQSLEVDLPDYAEITLQQIALDGRIVSMQRYGHFQRGRHRLPIFAGKGTGVRLIRILVDGKSVLCRRVLDVR